MHRLYVVNVGCNGCRREIVFRLAVMGVRKIEVRIKSQTVAFEGNKDRVTASLTQMGYPIRGSFEAKTAWAKAKAEKSCLQGRARDVGRY